MGENENELVDIAQQAAWRLRDVEQSRMQMLEMASRIGAGMLSAAEIVASAEMFAAFVFKE